MHEIRAKALNLSPVLWDIMPAIRTFLALSIAFSFSACFEISGGGGGSRYPSALAITSEIQVNDPDCLNGGVLLETGIDKNFNNVLDSPEIEASEEICNEEPGAEGSNALVDLRDEPVGVNCINGGLRIDSGIDTNSNIYLDIAEVTLTRFVCSGRNGRIGWQVATLIETVNASTGTADSPYVAVDSSGNAIAVWQQSDGTRNNIWTNRYVVGAGWRNAQVIDDSDNDAFDPAVAVDGHGNAMVVWAQSDGVDQSIWANRYIAGTGWGNAQVIDDSDDFAFDPAVAVDGNGNAMVVWSQLVFGGVNQSIWANRYVAGSGWENAQFIEEFGGSPQVVMDGSGNAMAVWRHTVRHTPSDIRANRYVAGSGWGTADVIDTDTITASHPKLSIDDIGNAIVVWAEYGSYQYNISANRYVIGSGWENAQPIVQYNNYSIPYLIGSYSVSTDMGGNAVAVWQLSDGTHYNIWASHYVVGSGWGKPELIETYNTGDANSPQVSVDNNGNAIAVWQQSDGTRNNIWANRFVAGMGWGNAQIIETDNKGDSNSPQVSVDNNGNGIAVWQLSDGVFDYIWSNRFIVQ